MKVGLDPTDEGCFAISAQSDLAKLIKRAVILMVDEYGDCFTDTKATQMALSVRKRLIREFHRME